jgi:hypothetical protein
MYNYADDNTLSKSDKTLEKVISALEEDSNSLINWFSANKMQANPEKFQAISIGRKMHDKNVMFNLNGINLSCEDEVKLLGVNIDFKLNFNTHISNICKKIKVITKLPNSEQSYKGKVKTHNYINRQNQSTTGKL